MCCFSGLVHHVGHTRIFARLSGEGTQFLAYQMHFQADNPVAMILPLPVRFPSSDDGVRFVNLDPYPEFFEDMEQAFPASRAGAGGGGFGGGGTRSAPPLRVESVGDFDASFVPSVADFGRLHPQFRLPSNVWQSLPQYHNYGFAVFQLKAGKTVQAVHPMAFEFPTALRGQLFFPTVHIHDGKVHPQETFDHTLYLQAGRVAMGQGDWQRSKDNAGQVVDFQKARGIVASQQTLYKRNLSGLLPNRDTVVRVA